MEIFEPVLSEREKYQQTVIAKETQHLNKLSGTNIYKNLVHNINLFKTMHKEMDKFGKEFFGHTIGNKLLEASGAFIRSYSVTKLDEKLVHIQQSVDAMSEITGLLKVGYSVNVFINDTYTKFFDCHTKTKNAIFAFQTHLMFQKGEAERKQSKQSEQTS